MEILHTCTTYAMTARALEYCCVASLDHMMLDGQINTCPDYAHERRNVIAWIISNVDVLERWVYCTCERKPQNLDSVQ